MGSGFIARNFLSELQRRKKCELSAVLTRRPVDEVAKQINIFSELVTNNIEKLVDDSDIVVECSGDPIWATEVCFQALCGVRKVITMDAELQITTGSFLQRWGYFTEAEGDQPGSLAALHQECVEEGFRPLVYGNIKGYLNHKPTPEDMDYWSIKNGTSVSQTTSFTNGTKIQIEQTLVANGLGGTIVQQGLLGLKEDDLKIGAEKLAQEAEKAGMAISDYLLSGKLPAGVFIAATHNELQQNALRYFKLGSGPYYTLLKPYHLCHLEMFKTLNNVIKGEPILLNNGINPKISVATIAKRDIKKGEQITRGLGGFDVRGEAVKIMDVPDHLPIGLLFNGEMKENIQAGEMLKFNQVNLPDSLALKAWREIFPKTS